MLVDRPKPNPNAAKKDLQKYSESKFLTVAPETLLIGAIALMNQHRSSCLLVESQHELVGIFTERDLVRLIASDLDFGGKTIGDVMTKQPIVLSSQNRLSPTELTDVFEQHKIRHIPLLDSDGKTVGVITHNSLRKTIRGGYLLRQKNVAEVMNHQVVTITGDRNIVEAAKLMANRRVSCVVVVKNKLAEKLSPIGIVTERDLVQFKALNLDLYHTPVSRVMSSPLFPVLKEVSLQNAHNLMFSRHIRRLVVRDRAGFLVGIITQTNILKSLDIQEIYERLEFLEDLVEKQTQQLTAKQELETEQRQKSQQSDRYLKTVLANIAEVVLVVKPDILEASVFSSNQSSSDAGNSSDRSKENIIKQTLAQFSSKQTSQLFFAASQKAIATGQKINFEYAITLSKEEKQHFLAEVYPLAARETIWIIKPAARSPAKTEEGQSDEIIKHNQELEAANKLLQEQIAHMLGFSSYIPPYGNRSWLHPLLPLNNKLGKLVRQIQSHNYPVWTGAVITLAIAIIIESYRRVGVIVPVPFMLLIISVSTSASLGGVMAGLWSHLVWSSFVIYAAIVGFGPETLTGGGIQVTAGIAIMAVFAVILGWSREQNFWLTDILKQQNHQLQQEIALGTKNTATINTNLRAEIRERIATQKALADSEQKFRTIFEQAEVGIVVASLDKKMLRVNPKFCRFTGYSAAQLQTMTFAQISHPDEAISDSHHVTEMKTNRFDTLTREKRYIYRDGSVIWGNLTVTAVKNSQNKPEYFIAIVQDITKRKNAELALEKSELRFQSLLNFCPFLIWTSGIDGLCNFFNTSWLDFTGRTMEQELGTGWSKGVHPEDWDFCLNTYLTAFERRERFKMEYRLRQRNGEYAWILDEGVPRFKADGSFAGYIGTCVDISDRVKAKQERERLLQKIERERQFLESVLQQMPAGVVIIEAPSGKIILNNKQATNIVRYSLSPTVNKIEDYKRVKSWDLEGTPRYFNKFAIVKALRGEVSTGEEASVLCGDGIKRTLFINAAPIRDRKSKIIAAIATFYDITELKQAQAAKKDAENKSVLLKEIHHRIKNNLQIVSALLDLQSEQIQDKNAILLLEKSQARIHTMALIHEKLYFSKNLERINFNKYITSLVRYLRGSFVDDAQTIKFTLEIEPIQLSLDLATSCGLIINELIVNALEHAFVGRASGEIKIMFGRNGDRSYCLIVRDNGSGMSEELVLTNSTQFLGLSLVESLVEKQLKGSWKITQDNGCVIQITFSAA